MSKKSVIAFQLQFMLSRVSVYTRKQVDRCIDTFSTIQSPVVTIRVYTTRFKLLILHFAYRVCVFHMGLTVKSDFFPKQH
jgi:type III secretory pathway component EscT